MKSIETGIVILGGGCAAIWVSYELARRGHAPLVIEHGDLAQYASQRNQGWLHTGSLYAVITGENPGSPDDELIQLARTCLKASRSLKAFAKRNAPRAFYERSKCLYLYRDTQRAIRAAERLKAIGLEPRIWHGNLGQLEPILRGSPVRIALETPDVPMNCGDLLRAAMHRALECGTQVLTSPVPLDHWQVRRLEDKWVITNDQTEITCQILVMAVGPAIHRMPERQRIFSKALPTLQRGTVAVIDQRICNNMLVFRERTSDYLNLTPFPGLTTINLGWKDVEVTDCTESNPPEDIIELVEEMLTEFCPGIKVRSNTVRATFYECHKVSNSVAGSHPIGRTATRHFFWRRDEAGLGLFYIYPGKFTLALSAAQSFVNNILESLPSRRQIISDPIPRRRVASMISASPYYGIQTHYLEKNSSGALKFKSRLM
jgi:glycine/D-amino acid oxidase-like deaminating enzyme